MKPGDFHDFVGTKAIETGRREGKQKKINENKKKYRPYKKKYRPYKKKYRLTKSFWRLVALGNTVKTRETSRSTVPDKNKFRLTKCFWKKGANVYIAHQNPTGNFPPFIVDLVSSQCVVDHVTRACVSDLVNSPVHRNFILDVTPTLTDTTKEPMVRGRGVNCCRAALC